MRKCNLCAYKAPEGCIAWECEYINRIEAIDAYKATRWIPVTEQLPETDEMMLVSCRSKKGVSSVNRAYYFNGSWHGSGSMSGVTAWMPLPEPYEEEDNGQDMQ